MLIVLDGVWLEVFAEEIDDRIVESSAGSAIEEIELVVDETEGAPLD